MRIPATITNPSLTPTKAHPADAGIDLRAATPGTLEPGERATIPTGLALALPIGQVALVLDRSGLAANHGITHMAGVVDSGYRGEIRVVLHNTSNHTWTWETGDRIAQLVILGLPHVVLDMVDTLPDRTDRGDAGFGSTGAA